MTKNATTTVTPTAIFLTKDAGPLRETTRWLEIEHDPQNPPPVIEDLRKAGWQTDADRGRRPAPPAPLVPDNHQWGQPLSQYPLAQTTTLAKPGTGLFTGWTANEAKANMAEARRILRKHGWTNVPTHRMSLGEMM